VRPWPDYLLPALLLQLFFCGKAVYFITCEQELTATRNIRPKFLVSIFMSFPLSDQSNLHHPGASIQLTVPNEIKPPDELHTQLAAAVPILMYHRVATDGPAGLGRFRVDPILFDEQLAALKQTGFRAIDLNGWMAALSRAEALTGRPIILTFDDGYRDFVTAALPALRRYSFAATVFLVADRIGGVADWDSSYGEPAALMSWQELREIGTEGVELGCHSLIHRPMTEMNRADLLADTRRAREILELGLGQPVTHFAYPYGAENMSVREAIAALGFASAVSCRPGISQLGDNPMCLPRVEVAGTCAPEELIVQLGS
jgi:peptidoglycan/xylan/chitin deacetylase (PgdA/CDA1 family)